eukprot:gene40591-50213_t
MSFIHNFHIPFYIFGYLMLPSPLVIETRDVEKEAIHAVEQSGIIFIDEIDKLVNGSDYKGADASSE